uniref:Uncharacterized protein n=1 Tax=Salix viminalis TaxID=40686 RepID=A0A6N2JWH0_SALVM
MTFAIVLVTEEGSVFHQFTCSAVAIGDGFLFIAKKMSTLKTTSMLSKFLTARGKTTSIGSLGSPSHRVFVTATSRPLQRHVQSVTEAAESVKEGARSVKKAAESVTNMSKEVTKIISETAETITDKAASIIKEKVVGK